MNLKSTSTLILAGLAAASAARAQEAKSPRAVAAKDEDSRAVLRRFAQPSRQYSTGPLWTWNDMLSEEQVRATLRDLASQQVKQAWVFPTCGLMTPYLSPEWFKLWKAALDEAERLDMNIWIYDENSYPSGFAGGWVPELMPQSRGLGLTIKPTRQPAAGDNVLAVYRMMGEQFEDVTAKIRGGPAAPGDYLVASVLRAPDSPWFAGRFNTDRIRPGVTKKFLDVTLEAYRREVGSQFGRRIPGVFTDEPNLVPAGGMPWTDDLPREFQKRWGYSLLEQLPCLTRPVGDWRRVRHNYYQTLLDLFIERWAKPYFEYCEQHGLEFTGHYFEHTWPVAAHGPDAMALAAFQHRPGIDVLTNQYDEGPQAQFGNVRIVKEIGSLANQFGRRTLSETFACSGWEIRMEDLKRQGEWQYALGLNTLVECVGNISIRGIRKQCWPMALSYHETWFDSYHVLARRFTRLAAALTGGREENPALLLEPTTSGWMIQGAPELAALGQEFQKLVVNLSKAQAEYDIGCEDVLARHGAVNGAELTVGLGRYRTWVLPARTDNLNGPTVALLEGFLKGGGTVLALGEPPTRVDGQVSDRPAALAKNPGWKRIDADSLPTALRARAGDGFAIERPADDQGLLFHMRRRLSDGELVFLVNTSTAAPTAVKLTSRMNGVEQWRLDAGDTAPFPFRATATGVEADFHLPPVGSILLFLPRAPRPPAAAPPPSRLESVAPSGPLEVKRSQPNVLVLDYLDVKCQGQELKNAYFHAASQFVFRQHGFKDIPWSHAVQFKDEIISRAFPVESGFEATYRFTIDNEAPLALWAVVERPDLYVMTCNGRAVQPAQGKWWIDRGFGMIDLSAVTRPGANEVHLLARPFTVFHEIAAIYILGDFRLKAGEAGFTIRADAPLTLGSWKEQGCPFYAHGVVYRQRFDVSAGPKRYLVELPQWLGSVAKVRVNGRLCGHIISRPWRADVTRQIRAGTNEIEVEAIGTLKNALGPFHGKLAEGNVWPQHFMAGPKQGPPPGIQYHTLGYGLFKPFLLRREVGQMERAAKP